MKMAAYVLIALALLGSLYAAWRTLQAAANRDEQPADTNDMIVVVAMIGFCVCLGLAAVVFASLTS